MLIGIFNPLGAQTDRLRCEVCQNLILRPMNTGLLRYAVATAPTVYGIETTDTFPSIALTLCKLQQHLPFTVLKLANHIVIATVAVAVATAPTVYGIETDAFHCFSISYHMVATAPTVYGIETNQIFGF